MKTFLTYAARRLLILVPLMFGVTVVAFFLVHIGQASPAVLIAGPQASPQELASVNHAWGFDRPLTTQYWMYLTNLFHGDMGRSWITGQTVVHELFSRAEISLQLILLGAIAASVVGVAMGFISAIRNGRSVDHAVRIVTLLGVAAPIFWVGIVLIFVFFTRLQWAPPPLGGANPLHDIASGHWGKAGSSLKAFILPVVTLTIAAGAVIAKQSRATILEVVDSEAVRYARACGLPTWQVHRLILRNALPGIVTFIAICFNFIIGGSALVEVLFSFGGVGQFGLRAVTESDFAVVQGYILLLGVTMAFVYLVADLTVAALDPRIRLQ